MAVQSEVLVQRLKSTLGPKGYIEDASEKAPFLVDERELYAGRSPLVARPATTAEVAAVVTLCAEAGVPIVPQGGKTGYVGGGVPHESGDEIVLSLSRMNRVREIDALDYTMTVEAGCVLADIQRRAEEADRLFPLSLGAEGTCQIGGNLSTNAGGTGVLRYGNARDLVLGLEVVLPNGAIWEGLRRLRKDNTGYKMKDLFLGAEGTLGIITAAVLKLFPRPREISTALVAVPDTSAATQLLAQLRESTGDSVVTFEYMQRSCLDLVVRCMEGAQNPIEGEHEHYVLVELSSGRADGALSPMLESALGSAMEDELVLDAVIASSDSQARTLWRLRETIPEAQKRAGASIKHDVSVPVSKAPEFIRSASALCEAEVPGVLVIAFGHMGDGNIHFNLTQPAEMDASVFESLKFRITPMIHDLAHEFGGSFSAEHGVGRFKRDELRRYRSPVELQMMEAVKRALDPANLMNPGKVL